MWAPRKQRVCSILKFERANHATQTVLQSPSLPPQTIPFSNYPEEKNRRKEKQQINCYQRSKTDANHGVTLAPGFGCRRAMSLPHSIVTIPHARNESALPRFAMLSGKRQRAIYKRACSSSAGSPDELTRKQYQISPSLFAATRKRIVWGASSLDPVKCTSGKVGAPKTSNSFENEMDVLKIPVLGAVFSRTSHTAPVAWQLGMRSSPSRGGMSFNVGSCAE